jgi:hypothetical protein
MKNRRPALAAFCGAALLAGCAPLDWQKPGADADAAGLDLAECQRIGQLTASRMGLAAALPSAPMIITTPSGATAVQSAPMSPAGSDPTLAQQYTADCMHKKGYSLVKSKQGD